MKSFNEICERYGMKPEDFERKLYLTLKNIGDGKDVRVLDLQAYSVRKDFLHYNGYIYRDYPHDELTILGREAIERGWVYLNTNKVNKQEINGLIKALLNSTLPRLKDLWEFIFKKAD